MPPNRSSCFWQIGSWHWLKKPNLLCCLCLYMAMNTRSDTQGSHNAVLQRQLCCEIRSFPGIGKGTPDKKKGITTLVSFSFFSPFIFSPLTYLNYSCTCQAAWQFLQWTATLQRKNTPVSNMLWNHMLCHYSFLHITYCKFSCRFIAAGRPALPLLS